jgi:hypothetical protein
MHTSLLKFVYTYDILHVSANHVANDKEVQLFSCLTPVDQIDVNSLFHASAILPHGKENDE